jgi:hypothetical protein
VILLKEVEKGSRRFQCLVRVLDFPFYQELIHIFCSIEQRVCSESIAHAVLDPHLECTPQKNASTFPVLRTVPETQSKASSVQIIER